jgi:ATP-dependent Clp protease ATP-binding subunit ClpA
MGVELLRFDMSEYMEKHTVSRLIGAPPGYVGFDQGGLLTDGIDQHPHSVLLLDEIEKAHPDLFNILLQVMDHGKLTDHNGKQIDFRNVVLIMTTNAGAADLAKAPMGFARSKRDGDDSEAINRMFSPEFRNRLDAVIAFSGLPPVIIEKVVEKLEKGYDEKFGARPLARVIQENIKRPLADELLFGKLENGGTVKVVVKGTGEGRELAFEYFAADPKRAKAKSEDDEDEDEVTKSKPMLVGAAQRKALSGPKAKKERKSKSSGVGAVPNVPRRKDR